MRAAGAVEHLQALQAIADANGGTRAAGTPGYEASVDYVVKTLRDAGWQVSIDEFPFTYVGPATLQQLTPVNATNPTGPFTGSGPGNLTAAVTPVDLQLGLGNTSTSGCQAADFAGFPAGTIALIQRGGCNFDVKALNAQAAGAAGVIIFNQGNLDTADRQDLIVGTLGGPNVVRIPVVGASYQQGVALAAAGSTAKIFVPAPEQRPQKNVIAELPGVNDDNVVMAGAHLDSVQAGPGINDNGSGSASLLEVAQNMAKNKPQNTVRLAWWGAEEAGLIGSTEYVNGLSQPDGSVAIEDLFESYFTKVGRPYDDAEFSGRSDYQAFIINGIPAGGLFTGAEEIKNAQQQAIWGGQAGVAFDHCYHQACDTIANVNLEALDVNIDAIALAVLAYSYSTQAVNGVTGKPVPGGLKLPAPAGPQESWSAGGGGLAHDHGHSVSS